ncbi:MAG: 6-aminohexanoate hydrolase [Gammaproteobacteria bacterium]|nr:MAG: 6-aminohexanoate hydrolase [Gammaproteobacteria bacterium]
MKRTKKYLAAILLMIPLFACAEEGSNLSGLWESYKRFGPDVHGPLLIDERLQSAEAGPYIVDVTNDGDSISFSLPDDQGRFIGQLKGQSIQGHWIQPPPQQIGQNMASPIVLERIDNGMWRGDIRPRASEYTFFLPIKSGADGALTTFLRNPDRNLGIFTNIRRIEQNGSALSFIGGFFRSTDEQVLASGSYDEEYDVITMVLPPWRGGTYDFQRVPDDTNSHFHARSKNASPWKYTQPPELDDGWNTSTLADVGLDEAPIRQMIDEEIRTLDDNLHSHRVHGVLIARNGKLVVEEYFHGFDRNTPHDTRSASKSMASMLVGAAMEAGFDVSVDTPVYETMRGQSTDRELRKQAMTLKHLLTMSSGFYCDDNDSDAPGNENTLQEQQDEPNWYKYTLDLPMAYDPGTNAIYCSANSNLIGAVLSGATGESLMDLFADLIARPLGVKQYYLGLQPTGEPYLGGGAHWLPRDFMKLGQVMLNGGTWNGHRIVSEEWAAESTQAQVKIGDRDYGYQWWINEYPFRDGTVHAFFAAGNGGQIIMGIPELDLLIAFYGGNYSDAVLYRAQNVLIPEYILKSVKSAVKSL